MSRAPMIKTSTKPLALKLQALLELNQFGQRVLPQPLSRPEPSPCHHLRSYGVVEQTIASFYSQSNNHNVKYRVSVSRTC